MNEVQGKVVSVSSADAERHAVLEVDPAAACPRCAAGKGCGAAVFADRKRQIDALVAPGLEIRVGQTVTVSLGQGRVLRAALLVYGLPLAGGVFGAILAWSLAFGDAAAAGFALAGLAAGLAASRWRLDRAACLRSFQPVVTMSTSGAGND